MGIFGGGACPLAPPPSLRPCLLLMHDIRARAESLTRPIASGSGVISYLRSYINLFEGLYTGEALDFRELGSTGLVPATTI